MQDNMADIKFWIAFFRGRFADLNEEGASAVEYGLLVSLIAVVIIVVVTTLGGKLKSVFDFVNQKFVTTST